MRAVLFLLGERTVTVDAAHSAALLDLCLRRGIEYADFEGLEKGIALRCTAKTAVRLMELARTEGIPIALSEGRGLPFLMKRLLRRWGLVAGGLCAAMLLWLSQCYVWEVCVTGNESMTEGEVIEELAACGFGVGSRIGALPVGAVENQVLLRSDRLAWIAIRVEGTVATVQVVERTDAPAEEPRRPANLVASRDGQIEEFRLYRGEAMVKPGQAVRAGELLVSGILESASGGLRVTRAAGSVMARTEERITVEIPLEDTQIVPTGAEKKEIFLNFFQKSMKIFKSTGNLPLACDIIEKENHLMDIGFRTVPVSITTRLYRETESVLIRRSAEEAEVLARQELRKRLDRLSEECRILKKEISMVVTEVSVILECRVTCLENIAEVCEFEVEDLLQSPQRKEIYEKNH